MCKCSIRIRSSSGYASRDPQGGTSDGSVCKLSLKIFIFIISSGIYNEVGRKEFERDGDRDLN